MNAMIGDNTDKAERDRRVLFADHFRKEIAEETKRRAAAAAKSANRKLAKAYDPTFTAQKFEHYAKIHFGDDDQKPVDRLKSDRENLEWAGLIPPTSGGDLLAQVDRVDNEQMIAAKGFEAGLLNLERVSGYDGGSSDDKLWLSSYDAGKAEYDTVLPDLMTRIQAEASKEAPEPDGDDPFAEAAE